jgi:spore maturation protein CgeB
MKLQFLTKYYSRFLDTFYARQPNFKSLSHQQMLETLLREYFADTGALYHYSKKHNNECSIIIANCEPLQKQWAKEHDVQYTTNWEKEIAMAQIKRFTPDVFYIEGIFSHYGEFLKQAKTYCKAIVAWISSPMSERVPLNDIDLILSSTPDFVDTFRKKGIRSEYMLPAFDTRVVELLDASQKKDIPFSFVGGWSHVHANRKKALEELVSRSAIKLWGYGFAKKQYPMSSLTFYKNVFSAERDPIMDAYCGELWGLDMYAILHRSLVTFNIHESLLKGSVGNMRMFEASGVGTMLMNDNGTNVSDLFVPGKEIEVYNSIDEAVEKVNYYSAHPDEAVEIGRNAQRRTMRDYNYDVFVSQLTIHLKAILT